MAYIDPNQDPNAPVFETTPEFQTPPGGGFAGRDNSDTSGGNVMPGGPGFDNQGFIAAATQPDGSADDGTQKRMSDAVAATTAGLVNGTGFGGTDLSGGAPVSSSIDPNASRMARNLGSDAPLQYTRNLGTGAPPDAAPPASSLPGGPGGPSATDLTNAAPASAAGDRIVRNADGSIRGVKDASGYYSGDAWSGYDNIINNAQRSDPFAIEKVKYLAGQGDARAQTVLGGIPQDFANSQNYADWAAAHNGEIKSNTTGNNPNHIGDLAQIPNNPMPNSDVFKVQDAWGKVLTSEGRTGVTIDTYGNVIYDNSNGGKNIITPGWQAAQELAAYLQQKASAPPVAPPSGGGSGAPRGNSYAPPRSNSYAPPRGGGGGNGPSAPAPQQQAPPAPDSTVPANIAYGGGFVPPDQIPYRDAGGVGGGVLGVDQPNYGEPIDGLRRPNGQGVAVGGIVQGGRAGIYT